MEGEKGEMSIVVACDGARVGTLLGDESIGKLKQFCCMQDEIRVTKAKRSL